MITVLFFIATITIIFIFCFEAPRRTYDRNNVIPYKIKKCINSYRLFVFSSGKLRQTLLFLVFLAVWFLLITPVESDFIKNISYALIATFIFDTGINYNKENIAKIVSSKKWHSEIYSGYDRLKALNQISNPQTHNVSLENIAGFLLSALFINDKDAYAKKDDNIMWSSFSDKFLSYSSLSITKNQPLRDIAYLFLTDDYNFMQRLQNDNEIFFSFPTIINYSAPFYNASRNLLHLINEPKRYNKDIKSIKKEILIYLDTRTDFFYEAEAVMGHYWLR